MGSLEIGYLGEGFTNVDDVSCNCNLIKHQICDDCDLVRRFVVSPAGEKLPL